MFGVNETLTVFHNNHFRYLLQLTSRLYTFRLFDNIYKSDSLGFRNNFHFFLYTFTNYFIGNV